MKIVIAPDSFKESLDANKVAEAIEKGFHEIFPKAEIVKFPMADGGEGTVLSLINATKGKIIETKVTGPHHRLIDSYYGVLGDGKTAVIEMAAASGLHLLSEEERNPLITTTYGVGELIKKALDMGIKKIIIGLGGSGTNDGGAGMAQALGAKLLNRKGEEIGLGAQALQDLDRIDISCLDKRLKTSEILVACDVNTKFTGPDGASMVFGPQKGASNEMVKQLDNYLRKYAEIVKRDIGIEISDVPGSGAAGGLGGGLLAICSAKLKNGVDIIIKVTNLAEIVKGSDLVITGEGKIDNQTSLGKTPLGVAKIAKKHGIPVIAIGGSVSRNEKTIFENGIDALFSIVPGVITLSQSIKNAYENIYLTSRNIAFIYKLGINQKNKNIKI